MGEITEALRRAKLDRQEATPAAERHREVAPLAPAPETPRSDGFDISHATGVGWEARAVLVDSQGSVAEYYRHFALRVTRELGQRRARSLVVTSALRAEGKTTTACNLALALASISGSKPIALMDLDLRRPAIAPDLGLRPEVGLEAVLAGQADLADVRIETRVGGLDLYPTRQSSRNAHELLAGPTLGSVLREMTRRYEIVIVDSPPVLLVPDVPLALPHVDVCVAVARTGVTRRRAFEEMLTHLNADQVIGVFLNESRTMLHQRQYGYYTDEDLT